MQRSNRLQSRLFRVFNHVSINPFHQCISKTILARLTAPLGYHFLFNILTQYESWRSINQSISRIFTTIENHIFHSF